MENDKVKRRKVRRLDSIRLDAGDRTYFTDEGYLVDHPILTSCGIFEYTNPDGSIRRELRLPEHVFARESLKTYKGKPIIITHEAGAVNKNNVDKEQIGTILSEGYQDGEDVRAEIIIHDTDAMKACGLKELSLGYNLDLLEEPGTWNGEAYDAIQTNIVINHLALVSSARAGEQARLNIDSEDRPELKGSKAARIPDAVNEQVHPNPEHAGNDGIEKEEGGRQPMKKPRFHADGMDMTPEELVEAIKMYKASKAGTSQEAKAAEDNLTSTGEEETSGEETVENKPAALTEPPAAQEQKKDGGDVQSLLITAVEQLLAVLKAGGNGNTDEEGCGSGKKEEEGEASAVDVQSAEEEPEDTDGADDGAKALNADSADDLFRQRLSICRIGDKLGMDGLENKSVADGKRAIITKVLPGLRMDGRGGAYLDAAYDLAVCEVNKRRDIAYQRQQMTRKPPARMDGTGNESMAASARQRMLDRENAGEGGKE